MPGKYDKAFFLALAEKIAQKDTQVRIATLSDELTISQVVKFFERQGRSFSKTMIQNYLRVGILPPPKDKRYYTRNHLILLALIDDLKSVYSLEEIKGVLSPIIRDPATFEDDLIETPFIYDSYLEMRKNAFNQWKKSLPALVDRILELVESGNRLPGSQEKERATLSLATLTVMAQTIAMKEMVAELVSHKEAD